MKKPRIINIVGRSGSGKTTLVEKLIACYRGRGLRVSAVKSMRHDFTIDYPGKDSHRYREAGAFTSAITNGKICAVVSDLAAAETPLDIALANCASSDIVIIEGYREGDSLKIEVIGDSPEEPLFRSGVTNIVIIASDKKIEAGLPVYGRNDVDGIAAALDDLVKG